MRVNGTGFRDEALSALREWVAVACVLADCFRAYHLLARVASEVRQAPIVASREVAGRQHEGDDRFRAR